MVDEQDAAIYLRIGEQLRARRLEVGLNLEDVVRELNIRLPHLIALEEGRFKDLPGRIYATGFLRNYAEHLGLDADALLQAVKDENAEPEDAPLVFPTPPPESRLPHGWIVLIALIIAVGVYSAWYYANHRDRFFPQHTTKPPVVGLMVPGANAPAGPKDAVMPTTTGTSTPSHSAKAKTPTPADAAPATPVGTTKTASAGSTASKPPARTANGAVSRAIAPSATTDATGAKSGGGTAEAATVQSTSDATPPAAPEATSIPNAPRTSSSSSAAASSAAGATASPPPASSTAATAKTPASTASSTHIPQAYGSTSSGVQVVLKVRSDTWMTVSDGNGNVIFPGHILQPGDTYSVPPDDPNAVLWTGNLGGLEIIVNGKAMPQVGAIGQSERNIPLDAKQLTAFINKKRHTKR